MSVLLFFFHANIAREMSNLENLIMALEVAVPVLGYGGEQVC